MTSRYQGEEHSRLMCLGRDRTRYTGEDSREQCVCRRQKLIREPVPALWSKCYLVGPTTVTAVLGAGAPASAGTGSNRQGCTNIPFRS